jgi:Holliday junction resolvasome RuvABC endonuclease subunit
LCNKKQNFWQTNIILGIDPGTTIMGFGLIKIVNKKMEFAAQVAIVQI